MTRSQPPAAHREQIRTFLLRLAAAAPTEVGAPGRIVPLAEEAANGLRQDYLAALTDMLLALGAIEPAASAALRVPSVQAGYLLRLLAALLETDAPLVADWHSEGVTNPPTHALDRAVDLLAALEQRRLAVLPDAAPLRELTAALAVIGRRAAGGREYLLHWDAAAGAWQLPGGRYEAGDGSLRVTLLRELAEELICPPLIDGQDVTLRELGPPFSATRVSPTYGLLTHTTFQVYLVRFISPPPPLHASVRWLSEAELLADTTADGQRIATPFGRIVTQMRGPDADSAMLDSFLQDS